MRFRHILPACALALSACLPPLAQAANLALPADGSWVEILADDGLPPFTSAWVTLSSDGASYTEVGYTVTIASGFEGRLTVVDTAYAGDRFELRDNGTRLGETGPAAFDAAQARFADADTALADATYSRGVFTLSAGSHLLTGAVLAGTGYGATTAALKLEVSAVPEPATVFSLLAGLGLVGAALRRRAR
ncbi:PEP-CTERM sorting domain-containing protein [Ideonella sp. DXS22W]|uniref:PEP-CTERM sorting domain-containing protein n=1 Tax=Pseudaquabacterium inlustre TaxID=2984192 RepID=A0ABU9CDV2_9BURK